MFNTVREFFSDHLQRMAAREDEIDSYTADRDDANTANTANMTIYTLVYKLVEARIATQVANTRAAKNAALALLAFGLIAIEIHALALYFLSK